MNIQLASSVPTKSKQLLMPVAQQTQQRSRSGGPTNERRVSGSCYLTYIRTNTWEERADAERRQKAKAERKKADAEAQRKKTEATVRSQHQRTQELRSTVFAAARQGDFEKVKCGIWKDGVDAAGGEVKYEEFIKNIPKDPLETLLHIAAKIGKTNLFEWLDAHSSLFDSPTFILLLIHILSRRRT